MRTEAGTSQKFSTKQRLRHTYCLIPRDSQRFLRVVRADAVFRCSTGFGLLRSLAKTKNSYD